MIEKAKTGVPEEVVVIAGASGGRHERVQRMCCRGARRATRDSIRDGLCVFALPWTGRGRRRQ
jgi:hypothetical protein